MASEVDICNLSLGHLGDDATISSINPPEGSAQAEHCQRFYPIARDQLLEMHDWRFATKRITPSLIDSTISEWAYSFALPADCLCVLAILPPGATDDTSAAPLPYSDAWIASPPNAAARYQTQPFVVESADDGTDIIYTNQATPDLRYIKRVTDTTKFSPLFITTISRILASYLAGPILKGEAGRAESKEQLKLAMISLGLAMVSDSNQKNTRPQQSVPWMAGRL